MGNSFPSRLPKLPRSAHMTATQPTLGTGDRNPFLSRENRDYPAKNQTAHPLPGPTPSHHLALAGRARPIPLQGRHIYQ